MSVPLPFNRLHCEIEVLPLGGMAYGVLRRYAVRTIADLIALRPSDLCQMRNFSQGCLESVEKSLAELGLSLTADEIVEETNDPPYRPPLTPREKDVLCLRFGLRGERPHTWPEAGKRLHVSGHRAYYIGQRAQRKLKALGRTVEEELGAEVK